MALRLSILIATIPQRFEVFSDLIHNINSQFSITHLIDVNEVEILIDDSLSYNIGVKRNYLLKRAKGNYIVFIDDDDQISQDYIALILEAIKSNPDCIGINGTITTNGINEKKWFISKEYGKWFEKNNVYYRTPNHISPVKREIALKALFPNISHGEDAEYSKRILPMLKTETIIKQPLYHYKYRNDELK